MQKAFKWLEAKKLPYSFHNYKESGIDKDTIKAWLAHFPPTQLINTKGTTYRALTDDQKASISDPAKATELMIANTSLIKRPMWDFGNGHFFLGWNEAALNDLI